MRPSWIPTPGLEPPPLAGDRARRIPHGGPPAGSATRSPSSLMFDGVNGAGGFGAGEPTPISDVAP
jgi:hypothetical protein